MGDVLLTQCDVLGRQRIQRRHLGIIDHIQTDVGHGSGDVQFVTPRATTPYST
jgi:hypothetical protein